MKIELYDKNNIDNLILMGTTSDESLIQDYIIPMIKNGTTHFIKNVNTKMILLKCDSYLIPVTITENHQTGSYLFSMFTTFYDCVLEEINNMIANKVILVTLTITLKLFSWLMRFAKMNKTIIINNWLFSTSIHRNFPVEIIDNIVAFIKNNYPGFTIIIKSLNKKTTFGLMKNAIKMNFIFMPIRPVYLFSPNTIDSLNKKIKRQINSDKKFILENQLTSNYKIIHSNSRLIQLKKMYEDLYINKHSQFNAQYTNYFFNTMINSTHFKSIALMKKTEIVGFAFCFIIDDILSTPLLGYSNSNPNYYRATSFLIQQFAIENKLLDHASSGVGHFKRARGYQLYTEYLAWDPASTPSFLNRLLWKIITWSAKSIFMPMTKYKV